MILNEWKPFRTNTDFYTQAEFEEKIGDSFEAMIYSDHADLPNYIWTKNFVVTIKLNSKVFKDVSFIKIPRNPNSID
ncbi:hypothetical protein [Aquibacillus sediminis]|uniref:hypothetical protein n=1 Tax=Aquibacillus sediminis TaxID=2574734 RepID=UPI001109462F|nr:hypothetical protein [Aquibacillus sediminis]